LAATGQTWLTHLLRVAISSQKPVWPTVSPFFNRLRTGVCGQMSAFFILLCIFFMSPPWAISSIVLAGWQKLTLQKLYSGMASTE